MALIKCPKCGTNLNDDCMIVWKCAECGKAFKVSVSKLDKIQELKKKKADQHLLKCSSCGHFLDDGNEKIACKCSSCGNVFDGNLMYFIVDDLEHKIIEETSNYIGDIGKKDTVSSNLIRCPDCGREVSKRASVCPGCGCPLAEMVTSGVVKIKLPRTEQMADGFMGLLSSKEASISSKGKTLWRGKHGETASFTIEEPVQIVINLGTWGNPVEGTVEPKNRYELVQDYGFHMKATFRLSEVDTIDSGM